MTTSTNSIIRKHTLVIEGGQLGAVLALTLAEHVGLTTDPRSFVARRDGRAQVWAFAAAGDREARGRWVAKCREVGLTVAPAPWEQDGAGKAEAAVDKWAGAK